MNDFWHLLSITDDSVVDRRDGMGRGNQAIRISALIISLSKCCSRFIA